MNTKTILIASFAAVFAVSMVSVPAFAGMSELTHLDIVDVIVEKSDLGKNFLDIHIEVGDTIPEEGAFGYGIIGNGGLNNVLSITGHGGIWDHTFQVGEDGEPGDPPGTGDDAEDGILHPHVLDLTAPTENCSEADAEVDVAKTIQTGNNFDAQYETTVIGGTVWVEGVPKSDLAGNPKAVVAFTIEPIFDGENLTNLCLTITSEATP